MEITFQFYNADLLDATQSSSGEDSVSVVDNMTILAKGVDLQEAFAKLETIMKRQGGILAWAKTHECDFDFAINKFGLMGFM